MTVRPLRLLGDPILRSVCDPVTHFDAALAGLVEDLIETVQVPGRAGLAAPQIGVGLAVFSYNIDGRLGYVVNPRIVELSGSYDGPEACLSVPGVSAETPRSAYAVVAGVDLRGDPVTVSGEAELARCLQHETDHLQGMLYFDRLTGAARRSAIRQLRSAQVTERRIERPRGVSR
jgi:peptide deformylase